ncbi:MAG TPA: restriction endonuclease subunit S [Aequorivita sp.]|nr:restriction endonuclease subunit S [Aequorivita sp.]
MREDWIEVLLPDVCEIKDNLRKPINNKERSERMQGKSIEELYPYYGATGKVGYIDDYLTDGEFVLVGEDAAPFLDYTKDVAYIIKGKAWVNNHAHILKSYFNDKYLCHYLNQFPYKDYVSGTTRLKLTQGAMKRMPVKLAPLPEQRAIVSKIEQLFSEMDNGIANLKTAQEQLKVYRQAVLKKAFEGDYKLERFDKVAEIKRGKSKHRPRNDKSLFGGKYPFIQTGEVKAVNGGVINSYQQTYSEKGLAQSKLWPKGTLCLTIAANIADTAFLGFDACFPDSIVGIIADENILNHKYLNFYIQKIKIEIDSKASATAQKNINVGILEKLDIPIPSLDQQTLINEQIESNFSVCDKIEETITSTLQKAEALRQSILKKAFAGELLTEAEITACKKEKDWNPAGELLKRIKMKE